LRGDSRRIFVLLDANPLENIANSRAFGGVMLRGACLRAPILDALRSSALRKI